MLGSQYVIDHVVAEYNRRTEEKVYRSYTADMLMSIAEGMGGEVRYRYAEIVDITPKDDRTGDEIALDVIERAGLT